jgi:nucleotide-binding universal stress UspA family protein
MTHPFVLVVGIDFSDLSAQAFRVARRLAKGHAKAVIHAVAAIPGTSDPDRIEDDELERRATDRLTQFLTAEHAEEAGIPVIPHVSVGQPLHVINEFAAEARADLVVLGTHGRTGLERLVFGSVAEQVVRTAPCSVLVVRERKLAPEELIEPPCPSCVAERERTNNPEALCAIHHERHQRRSSLAGGDTFGLGALDFHVSGV